MPNIVSVKYLFLKMLQRSLEQVSRLFYPEIKFHAQFVRQSKRTFLSGSCLTITIQCLHNNFHLCKLVVVVWF